MYVCFHCCSMLWLLLLLTKVQLIFLNMCVNILKVNTDNFFPSTFFLTLTNHINIHTKLLLTEGNSTVSSRREIRIPTLIWKQQSVQQKTNWPEKFEQETTIGLHYNPRNSIHIHESMMVQINDGMKYWGGRTALPHRRIRLIKVGWMREVEGNHNWKTTVKTATSKSHGRILN